MWRAVVQGAMALALATAAADAAMPAEPDPAQERGAALQRLRDRLMTEQAEAQRLGQHLAAAAAAIGRGAGHDRTARAE